MTEITSRPQRIGLGIILIVTAVFLMSIQDAIFKYFSTELSLWQIFVIRGLLTLPMFAALGMLQASRGSIWSQALRIWPVIRALYMTFMFVALYASVAVMDLATVAAGFYTGPLFVTLMSAYAINEPVSGRSWLAVLLGFIGVLLVLQPGSASFSYWTLLPVFGGFWYALSNVTTRSKCQDIDPVAISLSLNMMLCVAGIILSVCLLLLDLSAPAIAFHPFLLSQWGPLEGNIWMIFIGLAVLAIAIQVSLAGAYQMAAPATIATFDYSYLVFATLIGWLVFSEVPNAIALAGMAVIAAAGLLATRRP